MSAWLPAPVLRTPHHLLAAVPFLLGFRPRASVVLIWLHAGSLVLTQRVNWPATVDERQHDAWASWAREVVRAARHVQADAVLLLGYPDQPMSTEAMAMPLRMLCSHVQGHGIPVRELLLVDEDAFWTIDPDFGELASAPVLIDAQLVAEISEDFALSGWSYAASREEVCAEFLGDATAQARTGRDLRRLDSVPAHDSAQLEPWRDQAIERLLALVIGQGEGSAVIAECAIGLRDIRVRDCLLWHLARVEDPGPCLRALRAMVQVLPTGQRAPAATTAAICAWLMGDGVRATAALEIATVDEPDYALARLVSAAIANGLPPRMWTETMDQLTYEACRHGLG